MPQPESPKIPGALRAYARSCRGQQFHILESLIVLPFRLHQMRLLVRVLKLILFYNKNFQETSGSGENSQKKRNSVVFCRSNEVAIDLRFELVIQTKSGVKCAIILKKIEFGGQGASDCEGAGQTAAALAIVVDGRLQGAEGLGIANIL